MVVAAHARPAALRSPSEPRRSVVVAAAAVLSLLSVLLVVALVAGTQSWLQARSERADRITQLIQAHRAHQALVREGQEAVRVRAEQDRVRYIASGVPDLWDAVVAANAAQRKLSAAADKRYANSQYVQTGDAFQLVAAQYACLAKVIEYDRAATRFAEELRTPLPARVAMKDKQLNCGVLAWPD